VVTLGSSKWGWYPTPGTYQTWILRKAEQACLVQGDAAKGGKHY